MNKITNLFIISILILTMVSNVFAIDIDGEKVEDTSQFIDTSMITIDANNGELFIVGQDKPNFFENIWANLFGGDKSFVTQTARAVDAGVYSCSFRSSHGPFSHVPNQNVRAGGQCSVGQFITYYGVGGYFPTTTNPSNYLFDNAWYKSDSNDMPNSQNYYINSLTYSYKYSCYSCNIEVAGSSEPSCLTYDKTDCVIESDSKCNSNTDYTYESVCLTKIVPECLDGTGPLLPNQEYCNVDVPPSIKLSNLQVTNNGDLVEGQLFVVSGTAVISGTCDGCVIETSLEEYGSSMTTLSSSTGACGDDRTTGIKVNVKDSIINFKLTDKATKTGRYTIPVYASNGCYDTLGSSYKMLDIENVVVDITSQYIPPVLDTCYICSNGEMKTLEMENCGDYSTNPITCEPEPQEQITCYYCAGTTLRSTVVDGDYCGEYYDYEINCEGEPNPDEDVICFYCAGDSLRQTMIPPGNNCEENTLSSVEISCGVIPPNPCLNDNFAEGCECIGDNWDVDVCEPCVGDECGRTDGNITYYIIAGIIILLVAAFILMNKGGNKK